MSDEYRVAPGVQVLGAVHNPGASGARPAERRRVRPPALLVGYVGSVVMSGLVLMFALIVAMWFIGWGFAWYDDGVAALRASEGRIPVDGPLGRALYLVPALGLFGGLALVRVAVPVVDPALAGAVAIAEWLRSVGKPREVLLARAGLVVAIGLGAAAACGLAAGVHALFEVKPEVFLAIAIAGAYGWLRFARKLARGVKRYGKRLAKGRRKAARAAKRRETAEKTGTAMVGAVGAPIGYDPLDWSKMPGAVSPALGVHGDDSRGVER